MTDIVNLNRFRKRQARAAKDRRAEQNRARFGAKKSEKEKAVPG
ncbi:MAG: DUF4169 family protein [Pseudomonadota bacterium]